MGRHNKRKNTSKYSLLKLLFNIDNQFNIDYQTALNIYLKRSFSESKLIFTTFIPNSIRNLIEKEDNVKLIQETFNTNIEKYQLSLPKNISKNDLKLSLEEKSKPILRDLIETMFRNAIKDIIRF